MPKFTIELDSETHRILKEYAKLEKRSLTNYLEVTLDRVAGTSKTTTIMPGTIPGAMTGTSEPTTTSPQQSAKNTIIINGKSRRTIIGDDSGPTVETVVAFLDKEEIPSDDDSRALFERY